MSERLTERSLKGRTQTSSQDTYDYTTPNLNASARTTDPYVAPKAPSNEAAQLINSISSFASNYGKNKAAKNQEDYEQGQLDRAKDKQQMSLEDRKRAAYIAGWEHLDGELKAQEFERQSKEYFDLHRDEDFETFQANYNKLSKDFIDKLGTDNTVKGFIERGLDTENRIVNAHFEYQQKKIKEEQYTKVTTVYNNDVDNWLTAKLGVKSLNDLVSDDAAYLKFYQNREQITKDFQDYFTKYLKSSKEKYGVFFNDVELSKTMYQVLKSKADYYDMPELMSIMETSDGTMREIDKINQQDDLYQVYQSATSSQAQRLNAINKKFENDSKEYENTRTNYFYSAITSLAPNDIEGAKKLKLELDGDAEFLKGGNRSAIYNSLNEILTSDGYPTKSDQNVYYKLDDKRHRGTLKYEDLLPARKALTKEDYEDLSNYLVTETRRQQDRKDQDARQAASDARTAKAQERSDIRWQQSQKAYQDSLLAFTNKKEAQEHYSTLMDSISLPNNLKMLDPKRQLEAQKYLTGAIREFNHKNGRDPMGTEWDVIDKSFYEKFPAGIEGLTSQSQSGKPQASSNKPSATSKPTQQQQSTQTKVPKGYTDTGRIDPKTKKRVYRKPNGDYVVLEE